jgi:hypothetical protein
MLLAHPEPIDQRDPEEEEDDEDTGWGRWFQEEVLALERSCLDRMDARRA